VPAATIRRMGPFLGRLGWNAQPEPVLPPRLEVVVVHTKTGGAIRGALRHAMEDVVILSHAAIAEQDPSGNVTWRSVDGEAVVPVTNIDWIQQGLEAALIGIAA
jgi:hypothetical protein